MSDVGCAVPSHESLVTSHERHVDHSGHQSARDPRLAAAIPPSKSTSTSQTARPGAPRCRAAPPPASTKPSSCATATPSATAARACCKRGAERRARRSRRRCAAWTPPTRSSIDRALIELDGTPNKAKLGANAILGVSHGRGARGGDATRAAALPLPRRPAGAHAARADDEHPQRRRARDQHRGLPGVHDRARGRRELSARRCAWAPRSSTRSRRCW